MHFQLVHVHQGNTFPLNSSHGLQFGQYGSEMTITKMELAMIIIGHDGDPTQKRNNVG